MSDPKLKITSITKKLKEQIEAQRAASEQIEKERQQAATNGTGQSSPSQSLPPNK